MFRRLVNVPWSRFTKKSEDWPRLVTRRPKVSPPDTRTRWNGATFPIAESDQLERLARYPVTALSGNALFAVALADYSNFRQHARSNVKPAAE